MNKTIAECKLQHEVSLALRRYFKNVQVEPRPREWFKYEISVRFDNKRDTIETADYTLELLKIEGK